MQSLIKINYNKSPYVKAPIIEGFLYARHKAFTQTDSFGPHESPVRELTLLPLVWREEMRPENS